MCTVTIIPQENNNFILTTNRDEAPNRLPFSPKVYKENEVDMLYPRDRLAGGTWIGVSNRGRLICLLNGGFDFYERKADYRQSRGIVVKDLLSCSTIEDKMETYYLKDIEPFTIVVVDWNKGLKVYELVWTGEKRHIKELPLAPQIWSSSTLYSQIMKKERIKWFKEFKSENELNKDSILKFHHSKANNKEYGFLMDRGFVKTTSITQVVKNKNELVMNYHNLQEDSISRTVFNALHVGNE